VRTSAAAGLRPLNDAGQINSVGRVWCHVFDPHRPVVGNLSILDLPTNHHPLSAQWPKRKTRAYTRPGFVKNRGSRGQLSISPADEGNSYRSAIPGSRSLYAPHFASARLALDHGREDAPMVPHERCSTCPQPSLAIIRLLRPRTDTFAEVVVCVERQQAY
jgi:hypothetical protein